MLYNESDEIKEDLYFRFKTFCKGEKKNPATVLKEFIKKYVEEREGMNDGWSSYEKRSCILLKNWRLSENEAQTLIQEIDDLHAEIIDSSSGKLLDHLMEKQSFTLRWD